MTRKVAIQMDPIEAINIDADSTFVLGLEAQARGYELYYYTPDRLRFENGRVLAACERIELRAIKGDHVTASQPDVRDLSDMDVVLLRQDPPFDMHYLSTTYMLEKIHPKTLVVNDPAQVRGNPEKLYTARFPDLTPPTLVTRDPSAIRAFYAKHSDIIIKPLYGNGGAGVFHVIPGSDNLSALMEMMLATTRDPIVAQAYLADVRQGDKRIILVDGEAAGAINRIPPAGDARANMHAGGEALKTELSARDLEICKIIGPDLKARGLIFTGIDVIGGYLTEINVTSPTGLQEIAAFDGVHLERNIWDAIETRL